MRRTISIIATAAAAAPAAIMATELQQEQSVEQQVMHRGLNGWGHGPPPPPPGWWGSSSSSGKSGKSGGSSSSSSSGDGWHSGPPPGWGSPWGPSSSSSGKSGKSGGSSSSSTIEEWHGGWGKPGWWGEPSSSSSGKSGKSGGSKGSKSSSSSSGDYWGPPPGWHCGWESSSSSSSGKSGKSGGGDSGKSGKSSSHDGCWHWASSKPWWASSSSSKSGKGSKSKGSKGGHWVYYEKSSSSTSIDVPDSSSPGICAPAFHEGGLECDIDEWSYCSDPGSQAECGSGETCYDKHLCPEFNDKSKPHPGGVCDTHGKGLECDDVTTFCTEPGDHGECGSGRKCYDAGLCGYGKGGDYDGVCGMALHGGKDSGLDCDKVTTKCTEPGEYAECAWGGKCYDAGLCSGGKGFCSSEKGHDCDDKKTYCDHPGESGQCPHGEKCYDIDICTPKEEPKEEAPKPVSLNSICFDKGSVVDCSTWGDDVYGDAVSVPFTYTVDTDGSVKPDAVIAELENAILDDFADHIGGNDKYEHFSGKISAKPEDSIADDDWCGDGHAVRCSVVKGEMSVYPAGDWASDGWDGDGHAAAAAVIDACTGSGIIKESMDGNDYSEIDGVTNAEYRNSDADCGMIIAGASVVVQPKDELSAGAAFGILAAIAALIALAFLIARKLRRKDDREEISLISNNLNNSLEDYDDPYANTIDVHKCTSRFCNCNSNSNETTFLPAPKRVDMVKTMAANGVSPTAVNDVDGEFFNQDESEQFGQSSDLDHQASNASNESKGSIMRVPIRSQIQEDQSLTPVNEVAHDSEIDTELESVGDNNDETTVPPPPPLAFHPAYRQGSGVAAVSSNDEISI